MDDWPYRELGKIGAELDDTFLDLTGIWLNFMNALLLWLMKNVHMLFECSRYFPFQLNLKDQLGHKSLISLSTIYFNCSFSEHKPKFILNVIFW